MLKSCKYCGRMHPLGYECPMKPKPKQADTKAFRFRSTQAWKRKRREIKERDMHLCQICLRQRYDTQRQYNSRNTQVHHIDPISEAWDERLDDDNLVTLCDRHHEMAESGAIPREELRQIVREQECPPALRE